MAVRQRVLDKGMTLPQLIDALEMNLGEIFSNVDTSNVASGTLTESTRRVIAFKNKVIGKLVGGFPVTVTDQFPHGLKDARGNKLTPGAVRFTQRTSPSSGLTVNYDDTFVYISAYLIAAGFVYYDLAVYE